mmetsp:Transcript_48642/g.123389  ORF Transcript_48642/g.123389 Transcript_48642/m.123389 type:complete len:331 (-) Transcript_48642:464-1456(-)
MGATNNPPSASHSISVGLKLLQDPAMQSRKGGFLFDGHGWNPSTSCCCGCAGAACPDRGAPKPPARTPPPPPPPRDGRSSTSSSESSTRSACGGGINPPRDGEGKAACMMLLPMPSPKRDGLAFDIKFADGPSGRTASNFWQDLDKSPQDSGGLSKPMSTLMRFAIATNSGSLMKGPMEPIILYTPDTEPSKPNLGRTWLCTDKNKSCLACANSVEGSSPAPRKFMSSSNSCWKLSSEKPSNNSFCKATACILVKMPGLVDPSAPPPPARLPAAAEEPTAAYAATSSSLLTSPSDRLQHTASSFAMPVKSAQTTKTCLTSPIRLLSLKAL